MQAYKLIDNVRIKEKGALQLEINLQDDYVKFFRFAQLTLEKSQYGIIGYISNNGYLRNPTLRGMRWSLLDSFQEIRIVDLHGEYSLNLESELGGKDKNVFDIQQGVSILTLIKSKGKQESVYFSELIGEREWKYVTLYSTNIHTVKSIKIEPNKPFYSFIKEGIANKSEYFDWPSITEVFPKNSAGIISGRDGLAINPSRKLLKENIESFIYDDSDEDKIFSTYNFKSSKRFSIRGAQKNLRKEQKTIESQLFKITHRPFDDRYIFYNKNIIWSMSRPISKHIFNQTNYALLMTRQVTRKQYEHAFITQNMIEIKACSHDRNTQILPLYLYVDGIRKDNINKEIKDNFKFIVKDDLDALSILDYCYSILHCPKYRTKYFSELKRDFPRIPYPKDQDTFWDLVKLGGEIRGLHLLESQTIDNFITEFPEEGTNEVTKSMTTKSPGWIAYEDDSEAGDVWINDEQYFSGVPKLAWEFYIGGYQPAHKWLKDRKGRILSKEDIDHYQKIIVALTETDRIMKEIDKIEID